MDDDAQRQALHIDQGVNVATLHLLPGIIAGQAVMTASFSAPFKDGLTMIAAVGLASRSMSSRKSMCNSCQIASHTTAQQIDNGVDRLPHIGPALAPRGRPPGLASGSMAQDASLRHPSCHLDNTH